MLTAAGGGDMTPDSSAAARVAVHTFGDGPRPVLLVHATGFHGRVWGPLVRELGGGFTGLAPDLRGHGDSPVPPGCDFDWRGFAADVLAVVDRLELDRHPDRPVAVGHSSGATALLLAEQRRPGTFAAIFAYEPVLVAADPPLGPDPHNWLAQACRRRRDTFASRDEARAHYAAKPPLSALDPEVRACYVDHGLEPTADGSWRLACRPEHEARVYAMATAHDAYPRLGEVACPVTLAVGAASEAVDRAHATHLADRLADATLETLPGLGHLGPLEDPASVAAAVRATLTRRA